LGSGKIARQTASACAETGTNADVRLLFCTSKASAPRYADSETTPPMQKRLSSRTSGFAESIGSGGGSDSELKLPLRKILREKLAMGFQRFSKI
jgi:hypothetical protein